MTMPQFDFTKVSVAASAECVVKPIIMLYLHDLRYSDFTLYFPAKKTTDRKPDGYFHPSTHPLWNERLLYHYLTGDPDKLISRKLDYQGTLSVTIGTAVHGFIQHVLGPREANLLLPPSDDKCNVCAKPTSIMPKKGHCWEQPVLHEGTRTRGHMDGALSIADWGMAGFEFKTTNQRKLSGLEDNDVAMYRKKWPDYYAQNQDYMRATGLRKFVVLIMSMGYPWEFREITVEYDHQFAYDIERRYTSAIKHAEMGTPPTPCCAPHSAKARDCFARNVCPVGLQ
jgi:hypothetical protein